MAKKKRRKSKLKYIPTTGRSLAPIETQEQIRARFPKALVDAYIKVVNTNFEDSKAYKKLEKLKRAYLGDKADDVIESGMLIVNLTRATMDTDNDVKKVATCPEHPKYGVVRKPRSDCKVCWDLYNSKMATKGKIP